jgi:glycine betaine catabolism A
VRAPLDPEAVERCLAPFGRSFTLPPEAYTSQAVFDWERRHLFEEAWTCVGRGADLGPGQARGVRSGSQGVLLGRDGRGTLRAFSNVCRHRGHELVETGLTVEARVIRCPYHAWVYGPDGALRAAPSFAGVEGFDRSEYRLSDLPVEQWHGWAFVNVSGTAPALPGYLGEVLDGLLAPYEPERLVAAARHDYVVEANWKLVVENYHECYHCTNLHPELCRVSPHDSGNAFTPDGVWVGGRMDLMPHAETMSLSGASGGVPLRGLTEEGRRRVVYVGTIPNLLVSAHPDYVMTHRLHPEGPGRTRIECEWLFAPESLDRAGFDPSYASEFWDITNRQDWRACESVQRGMANVGARQGPLSPREGDVYKVVSIVARAYRDGILGPPPRLPEPAAGRVGLSTA